MQITSKTRLNATQSRYGRLVPRLLLGVTLLCVPIPLSAQLLFDGFEQYRSSLAHRPAQLEFSPDGIDLYVASISDALSHFKRDPTSGALAFQDVLRMPGDSLFGLAMSADGSHLYATALSSGAVLVFARDQMSGALSLAQRVEGLEFPRGIVVGAGQRSVYVGLRDGDALLVLDRDDSTGQLSIRRTINNQPGTPGAPENMTSPWMLHQSADGRYLYVGSDRAIQVFQRDLVSGDLAFLEEWTNGGLALRSVWDFAESGDGRFLYAVGHDSNSVATFRIKGSGGLDFRGTLKASGAWPNDSPTLYCATGAVIGPTDSTLLVVGYDRGEECLPSDPVGAASFSIDEPGGEPTHLGGVAGRSRHLEYSPDGEHLYAGAGHFGVLRFLLDESSGTITGFDPAGGRGSGLEELVGASEIHAAPMEKQLLVGSYLFELIDTPHVRVVQEIGGTSSSTVTVSPDGEHLYRFSTSSYEILRYNHEAQRYDPPTTHEGTFTFRGAVWSGDGTMLFGQFRGGVAQRDPDTGLLTKLSNQELYVDLVTGNGNIALRILGQDRQIAVYRREADSFVEEGRFPQGVSGRMCGLQLSPDETVLFGVTCGSAKWLHRFDFDASSGAFALRDSLALSLGLGGLDVAIAPIDDEHLAVGGGLEPGTLSVVRVAEDLQEVQVFQAPQAPLRRIKGLLVSGRWLHAVAEDDSALVSWRLGALLADGFETGDVSQWTSARP